MAKEVNSVVPRVALGIIAWNEAAAIGPMLASLFAQSIFSRAAAVGWRCEVWCVANGCTDGTPGIAEAIFARQAREHPHRAAFTARVVDLPERGKLNAWNEFVHRLSAPASHYLYLLDADIVLQHPDTLWNMLRALEDHPSAAIATDQPLKDIAFKTGKSWRDRISLAASRVTQSSAAQLTGQLYCIRAAIARNIYLPRGLSACEDGFIKSLVCTDFLTGPSRSDALVQAPDASHIFEAYTTWGDILRNQKRQMIGQTMVHLLVDRDLRQLTREEKQNLAATLRAREAADPLWLQRRIGEHLRQTRFFWRLFPGILTFRFRRLAGLRGWQRVRQFPVALAAWVLMLLACRQAHRFLRAGYLDYWPDTQSRNLRQFGAAAGSPAWDKQSARSIISTNH